MVPLWEDLFINKTSSPESSNHYCRNHFILDRPAVLFEQSNPNWAPSLNLKYNKLSVISSPESACEQNARRKKQNENKTVQDEKHKGNKKILNEMINQNEIINSVTADRNNKCKETQTELSTDMEKENQELRTFNQKLHNENQYLKDTINPLQLFIFTNIIRCSRLPL